MSINTEANKSLSTPKLLSVHIQLCQERNVEVKSKNCLIASN